MGYFVFKDKNIGILGSNTFYLRKIDNMGRSSYNYRKFSTLLRRIKI